MYERLCEHPSPDCAWHQNDQKPPKVNISVIQQQKVMSPSEHPTKWSKSSSRELHLQWDQIAGCRTVRPNGFGAERRIKPLTTSFLLLHFKIPSNKTFIPATFIIITTTNVIQMQSRWVASFLIDDQNPTILCLFLIYIWTNLLPAGSSWGEFLSRGKLISIAPGSQPPLLLLYEDKDGENWAGWYGWWKLITITNIGRWGWACQVPRLTWMK